MLIRIVRMTFRADELDAFRAIFDGSRAKIRAFPGCQHLELLRDLDHPNVRLTLSHWESAEALETYRQSELFRSTWAITKVLFADRPIAFSTEPL
ncbi:putative quinol monooxygenase [Fibrella sp. WM1]|uniref:putative quinol monooxygenase n=1 Tax=Fibrella musci TaxID=3242485 RepID=UPI0035217C2B